MLSAEELIRSKKEYATLAEPVTMRIRYKKLENLQYISHLDLQRVWHRVLVRAGIPVWYTQGYNPHAKVIFCCPIPIGTQSLCECVDIKIAGDISCDKVKELLNFQLTDEMEVYDVYIAESDMGDITASEYEITVRCGGASEDLAHRMNGYFSGAPVVMTKKTKSGEKDIDILPLIDRFNAVYADGEIRISATLAAGNDRNLSAEMLISAMKRDLGILSGDPSVEEYEIIRTALLTSENKNFI